MLDYTGHVESISELISSAMLRTWYFTITQFCSSTCECGGERSAAQPWHTADMRKRCAPFNGAE